eukprot:scaffold82206_cov36-Phaeocystis_antarctica.AAC.2
MSCRISVRCHVSMNKVYVRRNVGLFRVYAINFKRKKAPGGRTALAAAASHDGGRPRRATTGGCGVGPAAARPLRRER